MKPKPTRRVKARLMWSRTHKGRQVGYAYPDRRECEEFSHDDRRPTVPVFAINGSNIPAIQLQIARAAHNAKWKARRWFTVSEGCRQWYLDEARAVLRSLGIPTK